jgi:phospholipid-transporting ATPase
MMNSQKVRYKQSKVEIKMNRLVLYIVLAQIGLCVIIAGIGSNWYYDASDEVTYLPFTFYVGVYGVIDFFSYFLLLNTMLPISLIVTLEIVKVIQSFFIMSDAKMYAMDRDRKAKVSSTSIIEELGQVNYIFSDKTGTLTRNIMEFKFLNVGQTLYGNAHELEV